MRKQVRPNARGIFPRIRSGAVHDVALGNCTQYEVAIVRNDGWGNCFVAVSGHGAYPFGVYPDVGYTMEKLGIKNKPDASNFSDFICDQMSSHPGGIARKGTYTPMCCSK